VKADIASPAGIFYAYQNIHFEVRVEEIHYYSHDENGRIYHFFCDSSLEELQVKDPGSDWLGVPMVELEPDAV
jgi:hypothetical protein